LVAKSYRWRKIVAALAAGAFFSLSGTNAAALSLGRITVQSALGEPLRAEIDVPDLNAEEAASLTASIALPEAFQAAGLDYNPALAGLQATLQKRADGRAFIRLSSERVINDPFVDLILEAKWASGRLVHDYTLLFDPPNLRAAPTAPVVAPSLAPSPVQPLPSRTEAVPPVASAAPALPVPATTSSAKPARRTAALAVPSSRTKVPTAKDRQVSVKAGDTASKIAAETRPASISLDQMLVALLRANPTAFMDDNVNRMKAGAVINVPTAEQAGAINAAEASQIIVAQSKDFNDFRRKLAGNAPSAQVAAADRQAKGKVQAKLEDQKPLTTAADKLTLSKGASQGKPTEDQLAKERSAKVAAKRAAEIAKNINELSKLGSAPIIAAPNPKASAATAVNPVVQAASAPQAAASASVKRPPALPTSPPEPNLIDGLMEDPLVPAGAIGLIVLLAGLGVYRARQRKQANQVDSSFLESRLQNDSFFGASGGESVDTNQSPATGSSMVYSPSQLDAVDAVDPVAEADVYLAYGRDLQAEEILRDALRSNPERLAIHQKLLEIFTKRRDAKGFGEIAALAVKLTRGTGPDWQRICELGLSLDPDNSLYQPSAASSEPPESPLPPTPEDIGAPATDPTDLATTQVAAKSNAGSIDLDLDLDFSLDEEANSTLNKTKMADSEPFATEAVADAEPAFDLDLKSAPEVDFSLEPEPALASLNAAPLAPTDEAVAGQKPTPPAADDDEIQTPAATPASHDLSMLEFDLSSLSLDLEPPAPASASAAPAAEDPLATKLALAQEFRVIGDDDGARALIEEVIAEASGDMKIKAQNALASL